ncbi:MAG TPA: aminopeptidase [Solirubrobacteraceae bacterium]|jgi:aminopeptidase|nr:aminopeptidase [Solirubrobacteraceae bacterium]
MSDVRVARLAEVIVRHSTAVRPGELCSIEGESAAENLIQAIYEEVLRADGHPVVLMSPERAQAAFFALASEEQIDHVSPVARQLTEEADVRIRVLASSNPRELSEVPPERQVRRQRASAPLMERVMARSAAGELRWALCQFPTNGYAAEAEMSLSAYEDFLYRACLCHLEDPVAAWRSQADEVRRLAAWIEGREEVHIQGPGTDLRLSIAGRHFVAADGRHNMPDGEFFTGPVEDSAEGEITFHLPTTFGGREVAGVRLRFHEGRVTDAGAERGEELLHEMLDSDPGARRLGELGIGTNFAIDRGTRSILFDEKIGGTVHLALGRSYPETGGVNESSLHWDLICDLRQGGTLVVDGEELQRDGAFRV